jgi:hypothetical protein
MDRHENFSEESVIHNLKHYLPTQSPLKDFIHHNTLHAFQHDNFHTALHRASEIFGYKTYLRLDEYRQLYREGKISGDVLSRIITQKKGLENEKQHLTILLDKPFETNIPSRIGKLRGEWKNAYKFNLSKQTHPLLFRIIGSYIDQGIAIESFPITDKGFLAALRELERDSFTPLFMSDRAKALLFNPDCKLSDLLKIIVGDQSLFEQYLFDQQFEHPGWSGMVSVLEDHPETLLDKRNISVNDFIHFELLLEIDALDHKFGETWAPLGIRAKEKPLPLFDKVPDDELFETLATWHEAFEWTYYDRILTALQGIPSYGADSDKGLSFQGVFCIDDRECSLRRHLENIDKNCKTFATAGFFNVEFYFQPAGGKFYTKLCPALLEPKHLIKEENVKNKHKSNVLFSKHSHGLLSGWIISQTIGFWSALKLVGNIFRPSLSSAMSYSFRHMNKKAALSIENKNPDNKINGLQVGFTVEEMADRIESLLKSIGLVKDFAPLVYIIGHGASSVNNPYYAGYDCGACSGRPGSVNARVAAFMANHAKVRELLGQRGINIPLTVQFIGGLQDTTRDEVEFYDEHILSKENKVRHESNIHVFSKALTKNAKERARRFVLMDNKKDIQKLHKKIKLRSVSLFEPRPEYNHATNTLCIIGRREVSEHLFLDRRSFLNSFDYRVDPEGNYLLNILKAVAPVCGGINLEYYFSRVDNQRLGAGSKLPHNVVGLVGVANGAEGDLRTGLPQQMIEIHDPLRLLVIVEHFPEVVLKALQQNKATYEWFLNNWIHLVAMHPEDKSFYRFVAGQFSPYVPARHVVKSRSTIDGVIESGSENIEPIILE